MKAPHPVLVTALACLLAGAAPAALADRAIPWDSLSRGEQEVLKKHRGEWSRLDHGEQRRLKQGAQKYLDLPPEKRRAVERKRDQYQQMSPAERERLRDKYRSQKDRR